MLDFYLQWTDHVTRQDTARLALMRKRYLGHGHCRDHCRGHCKGHCRGHRQKDSPCVQSQSWWLLLLLCYSNNWVNIYQVHLAAVAPVFTRPPSGGAGEPLALMKTTQVDRLSACYNISQKPLFLFIRHCCLGWTRQASLRLQPRFSARRWFPANQLATGDPAPSSQWKKYFSQPPEGGASRINPMWILHLNATNWPFFNHQNRPHQTPPDGFLSYGQMR